MKYIITERQYRLLSEEEDKVDDPIELLKKSTKLIYNFEALNYDLDLAFKLSKGRHFILDGELDLPGRNDPKFESLRNLIGVEGDLNLFYNKTIRNLGNLQFVLGTLHLMSCTKLRNLGNLEFVGGDLDMPYTKITSFRDKDSLNKPMLTVNGDLQCDNSDLESLDGLKLVKGNLYLRKTPLSRTMTQEDVRNIPNLTIEGDIYL